MLSELKLLLVPDEKLTSALKHFNPRKPLNVYKKRVGNPYDGGYIMIEDFIKKDGIAYSFGVGRNIAWETQMSNDYNNIIHMYDHTVNGHNSKDPNLVFHKVGLGGSQYAGSNGKIQTIDNIILSNKHSKEKNMTLQCDIEGAEWDIFVDVPQKTLKQFSQMNIEFHWLGAMMTDDVTHIDGYDRVIETLKTLRKNFTPFHIHGNNHSRAFEIENKICGEVIEVSYVRNDLVEFSDDDVKFPTKLDTPNNPSRRDIKLGNFKW